MTTATTAETLIFVETFSSDKRTTLTGKKNNHYDNNFTEISIVIIVTLCSLPQCCYKQLSIISSWYFMTLYEPQKKHFLAGGTGAAPTVRISTVES